nr:hypothetical protein [Tanacetum cinerariifolium]
KLLENLKELAEYDQSTSTDRPIFLSDDEDHPVQNKESPENFFEEIVVSKTNQEPPQDSDIYQLIEECSIKVPEEQKQKMEDRMLELVKICQEKEFLCIHDNVNDLIESTLDSKLLLINSNSQHLDKKDQEVKNIVEQPAERGNRNIQSLQNFRVIHKSSISFKNTSQISLIHSIAPILSTNEPEHLFSMGYEHFSITPETESDEVTESNAKNLLPIPSKCEEEIDIVTVTDDVLPPSVENDDDDYDLLLGEAHLFLSNDSIPPGIENFADDPEGDIQPPDDNFDLEPEVISVVMEDIDEPDEHFNPGGEIFFSTNNEDVDYFPFMFVIRIFLPYLILPEISPLLLSVESEDTIFDPGLSPDD